MPRRNRGPYLKFIKARQTYYVQWSEQGRTIKRSTGTDDCAEAEEALAAVISERRSRCRPVDPIAASAYPVARALDFYGTKHAPRTNDQVRIGCAIEALLGFWGEKVVGEITESTCHDYCKYRQEGREKALSDGTLRRELTILRAAVNFAKAHNEIASAPNVFLPRAPEARSRWLNRQEAARLLNAARRSRTDTRAYLPLFIVMALYTGARKGALLTLRWPQVDLENRRIDLNPHGRQRTSKGRPVLPIPSRLLTFLRLAKRRGSDLGFVINDQGRPVKDIKKSFGRACRDARVTGVTPHTLRHTRGTWLAQSGVSLWDIAGWLGHSDSRTTQQYAHHHPDYLQDALRAIDRRKG